MLEVAEPFHRFEDRFRLENHSFAATEWPVIDRPMPIRSEIPQIVDSNPEEALFSAAPDNAEIERTSEELREDRDDVELQRHIICSDPVIPPANPLRPFADPDRSLSQTPVRMGSAFLHRRGRPSIFLFRPSQHIGNRADVLAIDRVNTGILSAETCINRSFLQRRQRTGGDFDLAADVLFSFRNRVDSPELDDATSMLAAKPFNFRFAFRALAGNGHLPARLKDRVFLEQLLDPDFTAQTLGFSDPSDGYIGGFRMTDEALLQNLEREPFFQLHSRSTQNGSDRSCGSPLLSDDFTEVALSNS